MAGETTNLRTGVGSSDIQGQIRGILDREANPDNPPDEPRESEDQDLDNEDQFEDEVEDQEFDTDESDDDEDLDDADDDESEDDDSEGGEEGDDEDSDDDSEEESEEDFLKRTLKIDDDTEITVEEAKKGYLRQADYTRKTQEVAELKKHWQAEAEQMREGLEIVGSFLTAELQPFEGIDWEKLKAEDKNEYLVKRNEYQEALERFENVRQSYGQLVQQQQEAMREELQVKAEEETDALRKAIPELKTEEGKTQKATAWSEYGQKLGFTPEEMSSVIDHRLFVILDKAMQFDELQERRTKAKKKKVPKNGKRVKKGNQSDRKLTSDERARQRAERTFGQRKDIKSAAELLKSRGAL